LHRNNSNRVITNLQIKDKLFKKQEHDYEVRGNPKKLSRREIGAANFLPPCEKAPPTQSKIRTQGDP